MATPLQIRSDELRPLAYLDEIQRGLPAYYLKLRTSSDPYLATGAWCALLETKQVPYAMWEELLSYCGYAAVRKRAYEFFTSILRSDLARRAAETPSKTRVDYEQQLMLGELDLDGVAAAEAEGGIFFSTCDVSALTRASGRAEQAGGWRPSLAWAIRAAAVAPLSIGPLPVIYAVLNHASQADILEELANVYLSRKMHLQTAQIFLARVDLLRRNPDSCLKRLKPFDDKSVASNKLIAHFITQIRHMRAEALELLGQYEASYQAFVVLNESERDRSINPQHYLQGVEVRRKLDIPTSLPPVSKMPVFQMLGFPRSGTTLLENILNAHPKVETFEEISAGQICIDRIERVLVGRAPPEPTERTYAAAREEYYTEIDRRRRKPDVEVLVDKMPIRSADASFFDCLFPEWRYIFSVRHPFDVVLSCFKQRFKPNIAMENFRTFEGAVRLYDFTMKQWFDHFSLDDPKVHYVRYDSLVTDFKETTSKALDFLGVAWVDEVNNFAAAAEKRAATTPSYQKVRKGLSVGVQTYWRNYDFLFKSKAAEPLYKWAEHFGYPTS